MDNIRKSHLEQISRKEINFIYRVLEQYEFKVDNCSKVGNAYRIETTDGVVCLKRIKHGRYKSNNGDILVQQLISRDFYNVAKYYKTKDGKSYARYKKALFYVTEWIDGEECNLDDIDESISCVKLLAEFHLKTSNLDLSKFKIKNNLKNWPKKFNRNLRDMEKFQRIIDKKKVKGEFDILYNNYLESFYYKGMISLNFLNTSDYYKLSKQNNRCQCLCHDSFKYQNIIKKNSKYYLTDLNNIIIDLHVNDLGNLIRRLMFKKNYRWSFDKAKLLINAYNSVNRLSKNELELMLALIIFPHKFWKLGKRRYLKQKLWDESKYLHKLNKLIIYNELQNKFLEDFLIYISEYE